MQQWIAGIDSFEFLNDRLHFRDFTFIPQLGNQGHTYITVFGMLSEGLFQLATCVLQFPSILQTEREHIRKAGASRLASLSAFRSAVPVYLQS